MSIAHGHVLRRFGTRRQVTEIARDDAGMIWRSWIRTTPATLELTASNVVRASVDAAFRNAPSSDFRFKFPEQSIRPGHFSWNVPGIMSAAEAFLPRPEQNLEVEVSGLNWGRLGETLSIYHAQFSADDRCIGTAPAGLVRLYEWMSDADAESDAGWRDKLTASLGSPRWSRIRRMAADLDAPSENRPNCGKEKILHGWFSLGSVILPDHDRVPSVILSGPDICAGYVEYDLGTVIGELLEFAYIAEIQNVRSDSYYHAASSILSGYKLDIDEELLNSAIVCRILLHTFDFVTNVGWADELWLYIELLRKMIDFGFRCLLPDF